MKDINGNEFKVGCVCASDTGYAREVLKITDKHVITVMVDDSTAAYTWSISDFLNLNTRILHYRELAPDKNGFMLCEGDIVDGSYHKHVALQGMAGRYFIIEHEPGEFTWSSPECTTFVSRPTDVPTDGKLEQLIKDAEEAKQKLDEALRKARG